MANKDQTGYIKNRFIGFILRQIQDIIDYSNKTLFEFGFCITINTGSQELFTEYT
jgi:hypothetical protein